jgi:hypothetical protein
MKANEDFNRNSEFKKISEYFEKMMEEISKIGRPTNEIILDDFDLRQMLKIGQRKLAYLKSQRKITYTKLGSKCYYLLSDVLEYLKANKVEAVYKFPRFTQNKIH